MIPAILPAILFFFLALPAGAAEPGGSRNLSPPPLKLELPAGKADAAPGQGSIYFVGTATVILRYGAFTLLTDPNFLHKGDHVHLGYGLESTRLTEPAIPIEELPPIDLVLLSHYHGDHFDRLVEEKLDKNLPIVTTHGATEHLKEHGFRSLFPLENWQSLEVAKGDSRLRITSLPGRHGPPVVSLALPPVMGSMVELLNPRGAVEYRIYISGDTLVFDDIKDIPRRYPDIDLALLHLGGTRILGLLVTMDGEQGVEMLRIIRPETAIPIHYNDYEVFKSPLEDFLARARQAGLEKKVKVLRHGESYPFSPRRSPAP